MKNSTFGNAAPKNRSINLGVNLLGEWAAEQAVQRKQTGISVALLGAALTVAVTAFPVLMRSASKVSAKNAELRKEATGLDALLVAADGRRQADQPAVVIKTMRDRTGLSLDRFVGELDQALSAGNARIAVSSLKMEVAAAEIHTTVMADAEEDGAADAFARNAGEDGAKLDAITSSRPSAALAAQGMAFTYEKRVGVGP